MDLNRIINALFAAALAVLVVAAFLFKVDETQLAVLFRFGEIVKTDYQPGLHFKVPFINEVRTYDDRVLTLNNSAEEFLTGEKKVVEVDFFVKWRISEVREFYRATQGDEEIAKSRLLAILKDGLRGEFARRTVKEVVSAQRDEITNETTRNARAAATALGIEVVDVRIKRIELPDSVLDSVFKRMRTERERTANQFRAEGAEQGERIRADADREKTVILADAYRDAQRTRGEGDAVAAGIYAKAYGKDPEFYAFHRSLEAYRRSLGSGQDILVLEPDSEFFKYFGKSGAR